MRFPNTQGGLFVLTILGFMGAGSATAATIVNIPGPAPDPSAWFLLGGALLAIAMKRTESTRGRRDHAGSGACRFLQKISKPRFKRANDDAPIIGTF